MSITIAAIETDAANLFHAAIARAKSFLSIVVKSADTATAVANKLSPEAGAALALFAPQDAMALSVVTAAINTIDAAIDAAAGSLEGGVTITLPVALAQDWKNAKGALIAFESVI